ncbi:MAG: deoxyribonuclease IV [Acidobacteria bacterium]|nr:deoxyribonuclease IV [Acidobacteriota bacterium]
MRITEVTETTTRRAPTFGEPLLGAHMSIAGGVDRAIERGREVGCRTLQIFVRNNMQWASRPLSDQEVRRFDELRAVTGISPIVAHDSYLINLASTDTVCYRKSMRTFREELERCEILGIPCLVTHPGACLTSTEEDGLRRIADSLNELLNRTRGYRIQVCLETAAGQGTNVGYRFEHLARILDRVNQKDRVGICIDTCHIFAAGYDIRTPEGYEQTLESFHRILGIDRVRVIHANDSKKGLGCRVDRHQHIGEGFIGLEGFRCLVNDRRFEHVPKILETPKGRDMKADVENLQLLRSLVLPSPVVKRQTIDE